MTFHSLVPLTLIAAVMPAAALAQAAPATPQTITKAAISARLDADYAALDVDKDGKASRAEIEKRIAAETAADLAELAKRRDDSFKKIDSNGDGQISKTEFEASVTLPKAPPADPTPVLTRFDANKDGTITLAEFRAPTITNFDKLDTNKDGTLTAAEQQPPVKTSPVGR